MADRDDEIADDSSSTNRNCNRDDRSSNRKRKHTTTHIDSVDVFYTDEIRPRLSPKRRVGTELTQGNNSTRTKTTESTNYSTSASDSRATQFNINDEGELSVESSPKPQRPVGKQKSKRPARQGQSSLAGSVERFDKLRKRVLEGKELQQMCRELETISKPLHDEMDDEDRKVAVKLKAKILAKIKERYK